MDFFGEIMAFVLIGAGIFLSFPTGFIQFTHFFPAVRAAFSDSGSGEGVTSFQATATALAGSIGTANIAGVAGAIVTDLNHLPVVSRSVSEISVVPSAPLTV